MRVLQFAGESPQAVQRELVIIACPRSPQARLHSGPVAFGEVIEDVAFLVADAALHRDRAKTSSTAARSAFDPSRTTRTPCSTSRPLATRSARRRAVTVLFSVEPSHNPSGSFTPSVLTPSATTQQRPFSSIPSTINAARRRSARSRLINASRCSRVRPTNSRLTADFDADRSPTVTFSPTGSRVRAKRRVLTPASIYSSTTRVSGSRSAKYSYVASVVSRN